MRYQNQEKQSQQDFWGNQDRVPTPPEPKKEKRNFHYDQPKAPPKTQEDFYKPSLPERKPYRPDPAPVARPASSKPKQNLKPSNPQITKPKLSPGKNEKKSEAKRPDFMNQPRPIGDQTRAKHDSLMNLLGDVLDENNKQMDLIEQAFEGATKSPAPLPPKEDKKPR